MDLKVECLHGGWRVRIRDSHMVDDIPLAQDAGMPTVQ